MYTYKKVGIEDLDMLVKTRIQILKVINKLSDDCDMTDFEKIVFIADKIEPNTRDEEYSAKIRDLLSEENGLNKALLKCYKETIKSLVKRDLKICLLTIKIYNKLQDLVQN